ncbi:MAG TPA: hypothetical protein PLU35_05480 [Phycisphaerales bacterium]|nr:hypothetical protein [Phycisphaerales bacterium]
MRLRLTALAFGLAWAVGGCASTQTPPVRMGDYPEHFVPKSSVPFEPADRVVIVPVQFDPTSAPDPAGYFSIGHVVLDARRYGSFGHDAECLDNFARARGAHLVHWTQRPIGEREVVDLMPVPTLDTASASAWNNRGDVVFGRASGMSVTLVPERRVVQFFEFKAVFYRLIAASAE